MADDDHWMREALGAARHAAEHGDVPVGALVVDGQGVLLATAENRREIDGDPIAHAEILAIRRAAADRGHWRLDACTLYVTLEPCAMCAGALVNARVSRVVFGASDPKAGAMVSRYGIGIDGALNHRLDFTAGVLANESVALLQSFFRELRAQGQK